MTVSSLFFASLTGGLRINMQNKYHKVIPFALDKLVTIEHIPSYVPLVEATGVDKVQYQYIYRAGSSDGLSTDATV